MMKINLKINDNLKKIIEESSFKFIFRDNGILNEEEKNIGEEEKNGIIRELKDYLLNLDYLYINDDEINDIFMNHPISDDEDYGFFNFIHDINKLDSIELIEGNYLSSIEGFFDYHYDESK